VLRGVFLSLIVVSLEGLEFLVGIVKLTNLRSLRDFGINSGLTLVAPLLVCFSKSREMPNIGLSMRCEDLSVGVNISFVRILAMLSLIQDKDFWKEVRKLSRSTKGSRSNGPVIDGLSDPRDISDAFSSKLKDILNSHHLSESQSQLLDYLGTTVSSSDLPSLEISPEVVSEAFSHLKHNKSDVTSLSSNHFISTSPVLIHSLSHLFTISCCDMVTCLLVSGIVRYFPYLNLVKIQHPLTITGQLLLLLHTLSKVLEWSILLKYRSSFITSSLQFGFKQGFSSDLCTGLVKNVIVRYLFNDTNVYGCFLDASKAFERVDHSVLFEKLLSRNLPPAVVRLLLLWYTNQKLCVTWGFCSSEKFSISNGVRQGGVLSPIMFTVYLDDLLADLVKSGVGCFWNQHFVGAVCYADDVAILAPSPSALRHLHICTEFAKSHSLVYNAAKTQFICFSQKPSTVQSEPYIFG